MKNNYKFIAYDTRRKIDTGYVIDFPVKVFVYGFDNESSALKEVKKMVKRDGYYLEESWPYIEKSDNKHDVILRKQDTVLDMLIKWLKKESK